MIVKLITTGAVAEANQTEGPCYINFGPDNGGEQVVEEGMWLVQFPGGWPLKLTTELFNTQFAME